MQFVNVTEPSYYYIDRHMNQLSRQQCMKHKLVAIGYDATKTEFEIMAERGFHRCYNSGNYIYEYIKK